MLLANIFDELVRRLLDIRSFCISCFELVCGVVDRKVFASKRSAFLLSVFMLVLIAVGMYILNRHTTLIVDDYGYFFDYRGKPFDSLSDIIDRLWHHYFEWGGRVIVHFIAIVFLTLGKPVFNIFNTLAYILLTLVIYYLALGTLPSPGKRSYPMILLGTTFMFWTFAPAFGQDFLWLVGASNYLWGPLLFCLALVPFRRQIFKSADQFHKRLAYPLFFVGSALAAWTNENMGLALVALMGVFILYFWYTERKLYPWTIWALLGAVTGALLLILAPGNFVRLHVIEDRGGGVRFVKNFFRITKLLFNTGYLLLPLGFFTALAILVRNASQKSKYALPFIYLFGMFISLYAMIGSPFFADRAKIGSLVLCIIAVSSLYPYLDFSDKRLKGLVCLAAFLFSIMLVHDGKDAYKDIRAYEKRDTAKVESALAQRDQGIGDVVISKNMPSTKYCAAWGLEDITPDSKYWTNTSFAKYWGLKSVRTEDASQKSAK